MLLQFSVSNFRSIKDNVTLSFNAATKEEENCFDIRNYTLLNSAVLYGANASGKSNLIKAMGRMRNLVINTNKITQSTDTLPHTSFKLNTETDGQSTTFEIIFFIDKTKYRYGFEYDEYQFYAEWLFGDEKGQEAKLFYRDIDDKFYVNKIRFKEGRGLENKTLNNHLFLWKCDSENGEISQSIMTWFQNFNVIDGIEDKGYRNYTSRQLKNNDFKSKIVELVKMADLGIDDISAHEEKVTKEMLDNLPISDSLKEELLKEGDLTQHEITTLHKKFNEKNELIGTQKFEMDEEESIGTQKFFAMSAPILDTLKYGKVLVIDELDASLHPILTMYLIKMFHDKSINKNNAQLLFVTHDTNLLQNNLFRRDQIWFAEKNQFGATDLYSLIEYKKSPTRKESNKEKNYLQGRYGAIPYINDFLLEEL